MFQGLYDAAVTVTQVTRRLAPGLTFTKAALRLAVSVVTAGATEGVVRGPLSAQAPFPLLDSRAPVGRPALSVCRPYTAMSPAQIPGPPPQAMPSADAHRDARPRRRSRRCREPEHW